MAYVDHAFSISDEDIMMEPSYIVHSRPPVKEIALAVSLLIFGTLGIIIGIVMAYDRVGGDRAHGMYPYFLMFFFVLLVHLLVHVFVHVVLFQWWWFIFYLLNLGLFFAILGSILFIPGFYYTRIAYYAYKGYKGFSFSNIPPV